MIVDKINEYLTGNPTAIEEVLQEASEIQRHIFNRQFMKEGGRGQYLGLSQAGRCPRQSAYQLLGFEHNGKEKDSRSKIVFYMGDVTEMMVYLLAKLAGCEIEKGGLNQERVSFKVGDKEVYGHPDGLYNGHLVEIKSMTSFSFKDFQKGIIEPSYLSQINTYLDALGLEKCIMIALNKDSGVLGEQIITKDPDIVAKAHDTLKLVLESTKEDLPKGWYSPDEKGFYPWNCLYCSYWKTCHEKAEKVLVKGKYKLKEGK